MSKRVAIVGGGISGLATAYFLRRADPGCAVTVFEAEPVAGGKVRTSQRDGYTVEWGPNGFLTSAPEALELARSLRLADDLLPAADAARKRYLFRDGGLRPVPASPPAFLKSGLLSPTAKLRAVAEPLLASRVDREESVYAFARRHFGREVADTLAEPLMLGITAGDAKELSLDALFPRFRQLEQEHRSLALAMIAGRRARRDTGSGDGRLATFRDGGTGRIIGSLLDDLGGAVHCGRIVRSVEPADGGGLALAVESAGAAEGPARRRAAGGATAQRPPGDSDTSTFDAVVLAVPSYAAADALNAWKPDVSTLLRSIPYVGVSVFGLGYDRVDVPRLLDGFGFLAPSGEGVRSLGVLWSSAMFPQQAPQGHVLLRVLSGGRRDPAFLDLDQAERLEAVRRDLRVTMGVTAEPAFVEHVPWPRAIPQYTLGHAERVAQAERLLSAGGLPVFLTGYSYRGVGLNDCIRDARSTAEQVIAATGGPAHSPARAPQGRA